MMQLIPEGVGRKVQQWDRGAGGGGGGGARGVGGGGGGGGGVRARVVGGRELPDVKQRLA